MFLISIRVWMKLRKQDNNHGHHYSNQGSPKQGALPENNRCCRVETD